MAKDGPLLTIDELAAILSTSRTQIARMRKGGLIPQPIKINRQCVRWRRQDVEDWVANGCPKCPA